MSIDAKVSSAVFDENGDWLFKLEGQERGQPCLHSKRASTPLDADLLAGQHIWGGASSIMLGETEIAKRLDGYTAIKFVVPWIGPVIDKERERKE